MNREQRVAEVFVQLADTLVADFDIVELLHTLVEAMVELLEVEDAGLMLADQRGSLQTIASSGQQAQLLELLELESDEGPCLDCYDSGAQVVNVELAEARRRWPTFTAAAERDGYRGVHSLPMRLRGQVVGALNLFCTTSDPLSTADVALGQAMADLATIAVLQHRRVEEHSILIEQLQTALNSRIVIEQAKGMLAERSGLTPGQAFTAMRAHARHNRQPLHVVAAGIIDGTLNPTTLTAQ